MAYLLFVTILWAFSFSLIDVYLAGAVDSDFAVLSRVVLAALLFLPLTRIRGLPLGLGLGVILTGALQFGVTYLCLYRAFAYLTVPEILLFTVATPIYVALLDDALGRRFAPIALLSALLAVVGAVLIRFDGITEQYLSGFLLIQLANFSFAAGQVAYKHLIQHYQPQRPTWRFFGLFFLGGILVSGPAFWVFGDAAALPETPLQWGVILWLGLAASGVGLFFWNRGACLVDGGTLAVMNNVLIPAGLVVNILIWNREADLGRLALGSAVIALSLWLNARFSRFAVVQWRGREIEPGGRS
ncbi:carboxylate/amino acid/amine transporter [Natronospira proteinivora]|uniref:Carboxylate/amino acid/amine transporter n=1 Tax=Natronospira proteinivora TaxID=1807133 RepID=A0ABT1G9C8_9GAMM|nr:EamA family transporter [Natronospira proteinivora]MCP1726893.1 carboxylate/amino acid/amine transporter [Natronospira proteinivora]